MQKGQEPPKEKNENNIKQIKPNEVEIEKENNNKDSKNDNTKKNEVDPKEKELEIKSKLLNKPKELLGFDAVSHFKENINHTDKNSFLPITEKSYYCLECKHSECPLYNENNNQKEHMLINRAKCFSFDKSIFDSVDNSINEALGYNQFKNGIKQRLENSINCIKNELDKIKEKKFQEIDAFFEETDKYLLDLKNKYLNVKQTLEDYYKVNKRFYNIKISKDIDNDTVLNNNERKETSISKTEINNVNNTLPNNTLQNNNNTMNFADMINGSSNRDIENTVFLINFEIMNLCETKNLEVINYLKDLKIRINSFNIVIQKELTKSIDIASKFFNNFEIKAEKIDDFYWDIIMRTKKYSEMIQHFKETISDIIHSTGNLEKIKDLIDIFDSKLKKNNKVIFDQDFFKENNNTVSTKRTRGVGSPTDRTNRKRNSSLSHTRTNSKGKLYSHRGKSASRLSKNYNNPKLEIMKNNYGTLTLSNDLGMMNLQKYKNENQVTDSGSPLNTLGNLERKKTTPISAFQKIISYKNIVPEDVILNQRVIERFFAYSISELFSKNFTQLDPNDETNYTDENANNIYLNRNNRDNFKKDSNINNINTSNSLKNKNKNTRGNSVKKNKITNYNTSGNKLNNYNNYNNIGNMNMKNPNILTNLKNSFGVNNNNINKNKNIYNNVNISSPLGKSDSEKFDNHQYSIKSVSYLANYANRYNNLKEVAKPIIGTNQIQLFSPKNKKMIKKTTNLNREEHGYNLFPEGCRHILVDDNLYIIGGTNHVRVPISIVLVYNISLGSIKRISDLNTPHSYHSVEYLENYDSIICIGGENSGSCEIMNLDNKKWYQLPSLNIPRANCNIYLNNVNGELFVLFGICGIMSEKVNNYSDSIEVLVLNDISQGWIKVDYYKTPGLNLKVNYCMTIPFTRNQLLIYGGSNMRSFRENIYALFHMIKNECNKVDPYTMELIKLEEKKSRLVDLALTKLG